MTAIAPFYPTPGSTVTVTPAVAAAAVVIDTAHQNKQVQFLNTGANICYVRVYNSAVTPAPVATAADFPIPPNMVRTITKRQSHDSVSHISPAGTTLLITLGEGF